MIFKDAGHLALCSCGMSEVCRKEIPLPLEVEVGNATRCRVEVGGRALANIGTGQAALCLNVAELGQALPVLGEAAKLRQVFLSLLSNAMKFTEAGGQVTVAASRVASGCVTVSVTDTGIDMSKDDIRSRARSFSVRSTAGSRDVSRGQGSGFRLPRRWSNSTAACLRSKANPAMAPSSPSFRRSPPKVLSPSHRCCTAS
jgi:signal transduction histidine kinase